LTGRAGCSGCRPGGVFSQLKRHSPRVCIPLAICSSTSGASQARALHALVLGARRADDLPRAAPEPRPVAIAVDEDAAVADHVGEEQRRVLSLIRRDELGPTPTRLVKRVDQIGASSMIVPAETYEYVQVTVGLLRASGDASEQDGETDVRLLSQRFHQTGDERPVRTDITTLL
jgi:hypothetical protein